ncbi:hypothetical protein ABPG75_008499 [Micractinium tetrahymenae]
MAAGEPAVQGVDFFPLAWSMLGGASLVHSVATRGLEDAIQTLLQIAPDASGWLHDHGGTLLHVACGRAARGGAPAAGASQQAAATADTFGFLRCTCKLSACGRWQHESRSSEAAAGRFPPAACMFDHIMP